MRRISRPVVPASPSMKMAGLVLGLASALDGALPLVLAVAGGVDLTVGNVPALEFGSLADQERSSRVLREVTETVRREIQRFTRQCEPATEVRNQRQR